MNAPRSELLKVLTERGYIHQTSDPEGIDAAAAEGREDLITAVFPLGY